MLHCLYWSVKYKPIFNTRSYFSLREVCLKAKGKTLITCDMASITHNILWGLECEGWGYLCDPKCLSIFTDFNLPNNDRKYKQQQGSSRVFLLLCWKTVLTKMIIFVIVKFILLPIWVSEERERKSHLHCIKKACKWVKSTITLTYPQMLFFRRFIKIKPVHI